MKRKFATAALAAAITVGSFSVYASHSWGNYHWARTTSSFTLQVIDSTTPDWDDELNRSVSEWSQSTVLDLQITARDDGSRTRKQCRAVAGKIRVCNAAYGNNGWLGLASISLDSNRHITQGVAKMNDSYAWYFNSTPGESNHVMCQEVGHLFGLGHTSEDGSSQRTCMDYSTDPNSQSPNAHDYDMLKSIYSHLDSYNSYSTSAAASAAQAETADDADLGVLIRRGNFSGTYVKELPNGGLRVTEIYYAPSHQGGHNVHHD
jgi:hypothetical protein